MNYKIIEYFEGVLTIAANDESCRQILFTMIVPIENGVYITGAALREHIKKQIYTQYSMSFGEPPTNESEIIKLVTEVDFAKDYSPFRLHKMIRTILSETDTYMFEDMSDETQRDHLITYRSALRTLRDKIATTKKCPDNFKWPPKPAHFQVGAHFGFELDAKGVPHKISRQTF